MSQTSKKTMVGLSTILSVPSTPAEPKYISDDVRTHLIIGVAAALLLFGGVGGWAATAELAGAVIANGTVVVDSNVKKIQHPTGGIVRQIQVKDGDEVSADDLLMKLDGTVSQSNLTMISDQLDMLAAQKARLIAERDNANQITIPRKLEQRSSEANVRELIAGERALFTSRRTMFAGQRLQLKKQVDQLRKEIKGIVGQRQANMSEIKLIDKELFSLGELFEKKLVPSIKITTMEREKTRLTGLGAKLFASSAKAFGRISEIELQIIQIDQKMQTEIITKLHDTRAQMADLEHRRLTAQDEFHRVELRSPIAGVVHQLNVHTVGGVIRGGDPVMLIVPQGDPLVIEAKIAPQNIDHIHEGQPAFIRFPAFNQRTTPEFIGKVARVAADVAVDQRTGQKWFAARITLSDSELKRLGAMKLKPGMPAEIQIRTDDRTALSYLMKPLLDQFARSFKEK